MILTQLPDLPPRPETAANAEFRRRFYARWGRENAIVCGAGKRAEYAVLPQALSVKRVRGGRERYFVGPRTVVVDDDNWLVLNEGRAYGSLLSSGWGSPPAPDPPPAAGRPPPATSFAVFFRPGLHREVAAERRRGIAAALDGPPPARPDTGFGEHLRPHGGMVSARLQHLEQAVAAGERDENWLEEQCLALVDALWQAEAGDAAPGTARPAQRAELRRRLRQAADLIESAFEQPLTVVQLAAAACLSPYHFVREFGREYGLPPHAWLNRKRARVAARWLAAGCSDRDWLAQQCGFGSRWSLQRALARYARAAA